MIDLSIIIVSYNSSVYLDRCLSSIRASIDHFEKEVIVVDNASSDGSVDIIRNYKDVAAIIQSPINGGFAGGNNLGISVSKGKYLLFLNPDTAVFADSISSLYNFGLANPQAGAIGPMLVFPDGSIQRYFCNYYTVRAIAFRRSIIGRRFPSLIKHPLTPTIIGDIPIELDWLLGSAMLIPRHVIDDVGMFDESYRLYFEDVDLCYRIKQKGYGILYYPGARIIHDHQRESAKGLSKKTLWHLQSGIRFFNKFGWRF